LSVQYRDKTSFTPYGLYAKSLNYCMVDEG
jgi:hypothetical protein